MIKMWTEVTEHTCKTCKCKSFDIGVDFDIDEFFKYWMDEVDPRGSKRLSLELWELDMGGDY